MRPHLKCGLCILDWIYGRITIQNEKMDNKAEIFKKIVNLLLNKIDSSYNLGKLCNEALALIEEHIDTQEVFWKSLKKNTNENAKEILPRARLYINSKKDEKERLESALCIAAYANVASIAAPSSTAYTFLELNNFIEYGKNTIVVQKEEIFDSFNEAEKVFFLTDNAGEIAFDGLVIDELKKMGKKVSLVVKDRLFFEDATIEDALFFRLNEVCDDILTVNKFFIPGEEKKSISKVFHDSDLIISKGTGNFEALRAEVGNKKIIYLLKVKCKPIAKELNVKEGGFVAMLAG